MFKLIHMFVMLAEGFLGPPRQLRQRRARGGHGEMVAVRVGEAPPREKLLSCAIHTHAHAQASL